MFDLGIMDRCMTISAATPYDEDEDAYDTYISIPVAQVDQGELQRLYLTHPWTWSHPACTHPHPDGHAHDTLLVAAEWSRHVNDPDYEHLAQDYIIMHTYDDMDWWIRDGAVPQIHEPAEPDSVPGLEGIRVMVDVRNRRLVLNDFLPFWEKQVNSQRRRKKRKSTVKIPGIKML